MGENRLKLETSPYLLQHSDNPVEWRPWGEEALEEARRLDRPILLSVGYAACHWCHVMAHESFENPEIAALMNANFINIKVDREERPDIDMIYQQALQMLGEHGGWPLTMFLTPEGKPFWGGTYFPPEGRYGRPAFRDVLLSIAKTWTEERTRVEHNVGALLDGYERINIRPTASVRLGADHIERAARQLTQIIDFEKGGIKGAPKFPQPSLILQFWRAYKRTDDPIFRQAALVALRKMAQGGIYDHLGGGFARYTVDADWLVPHFEKMLYDNAGLIPLYVSAWLDTGEIIFRERVEQTVDWLLREMRADGGAFASSYDADSEGEEGRYYLWTPEEIEAVLGKEDAAFFGQIYGVVPGGNFEGRTILNRLAHPERLDVVSEKRLDAMRGKLLSARQKRIAPTRDDKVLADWNGLTIKALARAGRSLKRPEWVKAAETAFDFIVRKMGHGEARLHHSFAGGRAQHPAILDDYVNMIAGALALLETTGRRDALDLAERWFAILEAEYRDREGGGYFLTSENVSLIARPKTASDNAAPAGNATFVGALTRLFVLTGKDVYRQRAEEILETFAGEIERNAFPYATLLNNLELYESPLQIVIVGEAGDGIADALEDVPWSFSLPNAVVQRISPDEHLPEGHPARGKGLVRGKAAAYVCSGPVCSAPVTDPEELAKQLEAI